MCERERRGRKTVVRALEENMLRIFMGCAVLLLMSAGPMAGAAWQEREEGERERGGASLEDVLAEVLENQTKTIEDRRNWLFRQQTLVRFFRGNGELAREELRQYEVRPKPDGMEREMQSLAGKVVIGKKAYPYADPEYRSGTIDLDGELADSFADEFLFEEKSRDGVPRDLFPVSREMVERHVFRLQGTEDYKGRPVYRLTFFPAKKTGEKPGGWWKGEMLVDAESKQPVLIVTTQAKGLPVAVRTLLGIHLKQTGFRLEYAELEPGVWFPSRYSGEFSLRVLFGYSRRIALSLRNEDFRRAKAESEIRYEGEAEAPSGEAPEAATSPVPETPAVPEMPAMPETPMPQ